MIEEEQINHIEGFLNGITYITTNVPDNPTITLSRTSTDFLISNGSIVEWGNWATQNGLTYNVIPSQAEFEQAINNKEYNFLKQLKLTK